MGAKRMNNKHRFECAECGTVLHPMSYRAACPDCGGQLNAVSAVE